MDYKDGLKKMRYGKVFTGEHSIKALLFVEQRFRKLGENLNLDDMEWFNYFNEVLQDTAEYYWESLTVKITDDNKTKDRLNPEMENSYLNYCLNFYLNCRLNCRLAMYLWMIQRVKVRAEFYFRLFEF